MTSNDDITEFANRAQDVTRSAFGAFKGIAEVQSSILQRLGGIQQDAIQQAYAAANDQVQLVSRIRDPREFASSQAELVKTYGQRYVDSVKQAIDVTAEAWQEYGDRVEQGTKSVANTAQRAASPKKAA